MRPARAMSVASKEVRVILRDRLFFALAFVVPAALALLFGYGLSFDVEDIPMVVLDRDSTTASRDYARRFTDSRYFSFRGTVWDDDAVDPLLLDGRIRMALIIPHGFGERLAAGRPASVQTLVDGTFPFRAETTAGYVTAINAAASVEIATAALARRTGLPPESVRRRLQPIRIEVRNLYNESVETINSLAPKLMMVILMISPPFLTALGVVREKETGSIYNVYASTVTRLEFLAGKLAPYVAISLLNAGILFLLATVLYGAPFRGSFAFFAAATMLYVVCTTGIGLVVSVLVRTQVAAMVVTAIVTLIPALLYSGVLIPIQSLSGEAQVIAHLLPAMYYTEIVLGSFLKGTGLAQMWLAMLVLAGYAAALLGIGFAAFSKRPSA